LAAIDNIRNKLIDKILAIRNKEFLSALDKIISSSDQSKDVVQLTEEQKLMLAMSEDDIKNGRLNSQEELDKDDMEWLER